MTYQTFAPATPPTPAQNMISKVQPTGRPSSRSRQATSTPEQTSANASARPKVWSVTPRMWSSGSTAPTGYAAAARALEVAHGVDRRPVDARLEVDVRAEAVPRAARGADHLALGDALADGDADARLVPVARRESAAVADAGVVAVAADPPRDEDLARLRGVDGGPRRHRDVDPRVQPAPAHAEGGHDRAADGPDEAARAGPQRPAGDRRRAV